jgi:hypothetical protein
MRMKVTCSKLNALEPFNIEKWTKVTVRQTNISMKLFQECRISRKDTDEVDVVLKEFGGGKFKVRISMSPGCATLVSPDLSWRTDAHDFLVLVVARMAKILAAKESTIRLLLTRRVDAIEQTNKSSK